jgi:predicted amidophosphoribosyltransferase
MALTQKEISHNCYIRRKENGLCPRCGKPLDRTGYYCSDCLKKNNEREKEFREWCKEYKICPQCKKTNFLVMNIFARNV